MRKFAKLFLVSLLVILMGGMLAACGETSGGGSTGGGGGNNAGGVGTPRYLTFTTDKGSSIFMHRYLDEFKCSDISYFVNYEKEVNGVIQTSQSAPSPLTEDMLTEASREAITKAGNPKITASVKIGKSVVIGTFDLHLQDRYADNNVDLKFNLNGGYGNFGGAVDADGNFVTSVKKGSALTWNEFISKFDVRKKVDGVNYAISSWKCGDKTYDANYQEKIVITDGMVFEAVWTANVVGIDFDLNFPDNASFIGGVKPETPSSVSVEKGIGRVPRPSVAPINKVMGYEFAGWFYDANDGNGFVKWDFNNHAGFIGFTLTAQWTIQTYTLDLYLMGANFKENIADADITGMTKADSSVSFTKGESGFVPFKVQVTGLKYDTKFADYYAEIIVSKKEIKDANGVVTGYEILKKNIKLSEISDKLVKGANFYSMTDWYDSQTEFDPENVFGFDTKVTADATAYAKWDYSADATPSDIINNIFNLTKKADGTLRIDSLSDYTVTKIKIPATITYNGEDLKITEIAAKACQNAQFLMELDLEDASNLKTIGASAFAGCNALASVAFPMGTETNNIDYVGENAFYETYWFKNYNAYYTEHPTEGINSNFIVINKILYSYACGANDNPTAITIPDKFGKEGSEFGVTSIASYCFNGLKTLERVSIPDCVESIYGNAFIGCSSLKAVTADATSNLKSIDGNAFFGTPFISGVGSGKNYVMLGSIYYRFIGESSSISATIPDGVKIIAPYAFMGKTGVKGITFENPSLIEQIGFKAFVDTKWVTTPSGSIDSPCSVINGFAVINGILVNYSGADTKVIIPGNVTAIGEGAFTSFNTSKITHITAPSSVKKIDDRAFSGCKNLKVIIFSDVNAIGTDSGVAITKDSFSNEKNQPFDVSIYLETVSYNNLSDESNAIAVWTDMYNAAPGRFIESAIITDGVQFIPGKIETRYLKTADADWSVLNLWLTSGLAVASGDSYILKGVATITYNNGSVINNSDLTFSTPPENNIGENTFKASIAGTAGTSTRATLNYTIVPSVQGIENGGECNGKVGSAITVVGMPEHFFGNTTLNDALKDAKLKFKVLGDDVKEYEVAIDPKMVTNYSSAVGQNHEMVITFNYEGLAEYRIVWEYATEKEKLVSVEQENNLSLPLLSDPKDYIKDAYITAKYTDGTSRKIALNAYGVKGMDKVKSNYPGIYNVAVQFTYDGVTKDCDIVYSITTSAAAKNFEYQYFITSEGHGKEYTATITALNVAHNGISVLPQFVLRDGIKYTVTKLANELFKDDKALLTVYIPQTITTIGDRTFQGCLKLSAVNGIDVRTDRSTITGTEVLSQDVQITATANISGLTKAAKSLAEMTVPKLITVKKSIEQGAYTTNETYNCGVTFSADVFKDYLGIIRLYDTAENRAYAAANLADKIVKFYNDEDTALPTGKSYYVIDEIDPAAITYTNTSTKLEIVKDAAFSVTANGEVIIPNIYEHSEFLGEDGKTVIGETSSEIVSFQEGAFNSIDNAESGVKELYLPNSIVDKHPLSKTTTIKITVYDTVASDILSVSKHFPMGVESIGKQAFEGCVKMGEENADGTAGFDFSLTPNLKMIGYRAFYGTALKSVDLSKTALTDIKESVFESCLSLESIILPSSVVQIGNGAFMYCSKLSSVKFVEGNGADIAVDGLYTHLIFIGYSAFSLCEELVPFIDLKNLPPALKFLGEGAFTGCKGIVVIK